MQIRSRRKPNKQHLNEKAPLLYSFSTSIAVMIMAELLVYQYLEILYSLTLKRPFWFKRENLPRPLQAQVNKKPASGCRECRSLPYSYSYSYSYLTMPMQKLVLKM